VAVALTVGEAVDVRVFVLAGVPVGVAVDVPVGVPVDVVGGVGVEVAVRDGVDVPVELTELVGPDSSATRTRSLSAK
jgi:hypothetical protein